MSKSPPGKARRTWRGGGAEDGGFDLRPAGQKGRYLFVIRLRQFHDQVPPGQMKSRIAPADDAQREIFLEPDHQEPLFIDQYAHESAGGEDPGPQLRDLEVGLRSLLPHQVPMKDHVIHGEFFQQPGQHPVRRDIGGRRGPEHVENGLGAEGDPAVDQVVVMERGLDGIQRVPVIWPAPQ